MSADRQHILLRHRGPRNWAALFAVVALFAWGIELVGHLHVNHDAQLSGHASHFCEICASFQAGASAPVIATSVPKLQPPLLRGVASPPVPRLQFIHSYRSRAPPRA